mmetsp:Transcript_9881/g.44787  ORF Transcript_9881/g.44787 Transcript_9881/m.44787 type:complete len:353 (-) Transcript_9881:1462-2520(-)
MLNALFRRRGDDLVAAVQPPAAPLHLGGRRFDGRIQIHVVRAHARDRCLGILRRGRHVRSLRLQFRVPAHPRVITLLVALVGVFSLDVDVSRLRRAFRRGRARLARGRERARNLRGGARRRRRDVPVVRLRETLPRVPNERPRSKRRSRRASRVKRGHRGVALRQRVVRQRVVRADRRFEHGARGDDGDRGGGVGVLLIRRRRPLRRFPRRSRRPLRRWTGPDGGGGLRVFQPSPQGVHLALELVHLHLQRLRPRGLGADDARAAESLRVTPKLLRLSKPSLRVGLKLEVFLLQRAQRPLVLAVRRVELVLQTPAPRLERGDLLDVRLGRSHRPDERGDRLRVFGQTGVKRG